MSEALAVILGGGAGTRLFPLTRDRAKPAVPLAGKYRLVDVPISNCINSGIDRIFVVTQFNSASLNIPFDFRELSAAHQVLIDQESRSQCEAVRAPPITISSIPERKARKYFTELEGDRSNLRRNIAGIDDCWMQ